MRQFLVPLSLAALSACGPAGEAGPEPATIGEQRALQDARQMIEQHAERTGPADEAIATTQEEPSE